MIALPTALLALPLSLVSTRSDGFLEECDTDEDCNLSVRYLTSGGNISRFQVYLFFQWQCSAQLRNELAMFCGSQSGCPCRVQLSLHFMKFSRVLL